MSERSVVHAALAYLGSRSDVLVWRNNTGAARDVSGRVIRFGLVGSPDIIGVHRGRFIGIECKSDRGRLSAEQSAFRQRFESCGGLYLVVRSVTDLYSEFPPL